ncbi:gluconeogenesis factor YvcK family protein [Corynebacterium caspium]|uniref:gluconeogenesis factor YvcK family protein n=1 Tax=Corynebacterium caspium TaxID=234828 RepID=UPI0003682A44|nr:uridine diphosphate-N-acetylglucosamine-binding protein YvcK [Corynebacterium caspium]WKD59247.1 Putative gluconeogenesis factor [Corynebacterium caspium DSM 44850]
MSVSQDTFTADPQPVITSLGGGHGLFQTLKAVRLCHPKSINAVVTVADDGGSSGRIRREMGLVPPGDLRMAIAALGAADPQSQLWGEILQNRFRGNGALAGHAIGNLLISGIDEYLGDIQTALDMVGRLTNAQGRVLPVCLKPLDLEAEVAGLDDDPRIIHPVRGQVAVATTPGTVRRVRLIPENPVANPNAVAAIKQADIITLGPGSWFSSVIPHLLIPEIVAALTAARGHTIVLLNLSSEPGETQGFSFERHVHMLAQHAPNLRINTIVADSDAVRTRSERDYLCRSAETLGAEVWFEDVHQLDEQGRPRNVHDPEKVAAVLEKIYKA